MEASQHRLLEDLDRRLSALSVAETPLGGEALNELAAVEGELWARLLTSEDRALSEEGAAGHPLLPVARRWRSRLRERGEVRAQAQVDALLDELHGRRMEAWRAARDAGTAGEASDPGTWFEGLRETDRLLRAALEPERRGGGNLEELEVGRERLRSGLLAALEEAPADPERRARWVDALVDGADASLTQVDDLPPAEAGRQLGSLAEELAWHSSEVEPAGGAGQQRLRARRRRLEAEATERRLTGRLERLFGVRLAGWWERGVLLAILLVLGTTVLPFLLDLPPRLEAGLLLFDGALCAFFVVDFLVKWVLTGGQARWFLRHLVTDLLPAAAVLVALALPESAAAGGASGSLVALRALRLAPLARSTRALLPLLRMVRALGFLLRGLDGVVRRYGRALDCEVVLHPTPGERREGRLAMGSELSRLWRLQRQAESLWGRSLESSEEPAGLAALRLEVLAAAARQPWEPERTTRALAGRRARVSAEELLERLSGIQPEEVEGELGHELVARVARSVRAVARSPLRWLPLLRAYVPRAPEGVGDADLVARLARSVASRLGGHLDRLRWGADLYGTMSPTDLVGQLGAGIVKRTARPVVRLLLVGAAYLLLVGGMRLLGLDLTPQPGATGAVAWLGGLLNGLAGLLGTTLFLVAGVSVLLLGFGVWLQRVASDASTYYTQVASAQFLHLTEGVKVRSLDEDADLFAARVFAPERAPQGGAQEEAQADRARFLEGVHGWLTRGQPVERGGRGFDPVARTVLLYRDVLDGALLAESDTRTTSQLLGNLALKRIRGRSWRVSAGDDRALARLDLVHRRALVGGPWMWFTLIARATTQQVARLIVDYNENAIPLDELPQAAPEVVARYRSWLGRRQARPDDLLTEEPTARRGQLTTAFTALHFLDDAPERDAGVEARFGPEVLAQVREDRRALFRRVFGTYPLHLRATEQRVLNPREVYRSWVEGGRVLLLPLRLVGLAARHTLRGGAFLAGAVRRIRDRAPVHSADPSAETDFFVAARKIDRMRGPAARACTWQRVLADVEYLGLGLPGVPARGFHASLAARDLDFLAAPHPFRERVLREHRRAAGDLARLEVELEGGLWERLSQRAGVELARTPERLRALVVAYRADYHGARSQLSALELCAEVLLTAAAEPALAPRVLPRWRLGRAFRAWWRTYGHGDRTQRLRAWRAAEHDVGGVAAALRAWHELGLDGARARGEEALLEVLRHPGQVTEQVVTLRAVQTLALIDLRNYRRQVWRVGRYEEEGDVPGRALDVPE